jgi:hypothetical protein
MYDLIEAAIEFVHAVLKDRSTERESCPLSSINQHWMDWRWEAVEAGVVELTAIVGDTGGAGVVDNVAGGSGNEGEGERGAMRE